MARSNSANTKDRERTRELLAKMISASMGIGMDEAREVASLHKCGTITGATETHGTMKTYRAVSAFIEAVIAQLTELIANDEARSEGVAFFSATAQEKVTFDVRTKREAQLEKLYADIVATRARFESVADMTEFLRAGGFIVLRNAQHSQSAHNFVSMNAGGNIVNSLLYASGGHDNNAMMVHAPMTVHTGADVDVPSHICEEVKVLAVRACGCPTLMRDPLGHLATLTARGTATGARAVAVSLIARHAGILTASHDVRQTIAHRFDVAGVWDDREDVAEWASREVKRGHEVTL